MYNAAISPIAAAAGLDNGGLLWNPKARRLFFDLLLENYSILCGAGIPLGKVGPLHPDKVHSILRHRLVANAFAWAFYPTLRKTYCSMSGDLPRGRTEIDYYNQHLIDIAGDRQCPINRRVVEVVHTMQAARTPPSLAALDEFILGSFARQVSILEPRPIRSS
jgi:2-dehydropantoate 2-reductase